MSVESCIPVIPSKNIEKSLRFWVDGLGFEMNKGSAMLKDGKMIFCMIHNGNIHFMLNQRAGTPIKPENYEGVRLYWAPSNIHETRQRLKGLGFPVSEIADREYGQSEFFATDDDGFSHCFGVATKPAAHRP